MQSHHYYRPQSKTLHDYLLLLVELGVSETIRFNKKEKQQALQFIASNRSEYEFSEAIQEVLSANLDKEGDKKYVFLSLLSEFVYYNGLLGFATLEDKAAKTSEKFIEYFCEELFSVFENRIQCDLYKIEEQNEEFRNITAHLLGDEKFLTHEELMNEYGLNESNFH